MVKPETRSRIFERDGYRCRRCGKRERLTVDHVLARSNGGTDDDGNLQVLCLGCNSAKGNRTDLRYVLALGAEAEEAIYEAKRAAVSRDEALERYRRAIHNAVTAGLNYAEIGAALGVSRQAVRQLNGRK